MAKHGPQPGHSSAPGVTLMPPRATRSSFGPSYAVSKLLKFFKLFGQRLNTESKRTIESQDTVTQEALPPARIDVKLNTPNVVVYFKNGRRDAANVAKPEHIVESKVLFRLAEHLRRCAEATVS
jgi:hypothetical protein